MVRHRACSELAFHVDLHTQPSGDLPADLLRTDGDASYSGERAQACIFRDDGLMPQQILGFLGRTRLPLGLRPRASRFAHFLKITAITFWKTCMCMMTPMNAP